jgi:glycosyltransferase involved in cell wall biosynthesis
MKYIFISTTFNPENSVYQYYKSLGQEFLIHKYCVVYIFDQLPKNIPENSEDLKYYIWPSKRPTRIKDFLFLRKLLKKYKPTYCIAIFGSVNIMIFTSYFYRVNNRIAWIRTTQSQILKDSKNRLKSKLLFYRKIFIYYLSTQIHANSEGTKQDSIDGFNINNDKISVLHNLKKKTKIKFKPKENRDFSIVIVGRLDKSKGHDILFKQFKTVLVKYPNLKLNVIGTGILSDDLKKLVSELELTENIIFLGKIPPRLIGGYFSKNLIGISSSHSEAFGWVNIESLNEGTPIISTQTEGAKAILQPDINGEFFYHNNQNSLLSAIERIFSNWDKYSLGAIKTFDDNFNLESVIKLHSNKILNHPTMQTNANNGYK